MILQENTNAHIVKVQNNTGFENLEQYVDSIESGTIEPIDQKFSETASSKIISLIFWTFILIGIGLIMKFSIKQNTLQRK